MLLSGHAGAMVMPPLVTMTACPGACQSQMSSTGDVSPCMRVWLHCGTSNPCLQVFLHVPCPPPPLSSSLCRLQSSTRSLLSMCASFAADRSTSGTKP
jgi:hypothetical protein